MVIFGQKLKSLVITKGLNFDNTMVDMVRLNLIIQY